MSCFVCFVCSLFVLDALGKGESCPVMYVVIVVLPSAKPRLARLIEVCSGCV